MFVIGAAEMLMVFLIVVSVTFVFVVPALKRRAMIDKPKRGGVIGDDGEVVIITPRGRARPFKQSGKGTYASDALNLFTGVYRMEYKFPANAPVAAALISIENAHEVPLINKAGVGSHAFRLARNGRYVLNVTPTDDTLSWEIEFKQL